MDEVVLPASKDVGGLTEDTVRKLTEDILQVRASAFIILHLSSSRSPRVIGFLYTVILSHMSW